MTIKEVFELILLSLGMGVAVALCSLPEVIKEHKQKQEIKCNKK